MGSLERSSEHHFATIDPQRFRHVLGHLPTGVAVVAAKSALGPIGMAANSVTSVSLDPPLILFCAAATSSTWPAIRAQGRFCVNIMGQQHEEITRRFSLKGVDRFAGIDFNDRPAGPGLTEALAWIDCAVDGEHEAGDHTIVVARVLAVEASGSGEPLVFFRGQYGSFRGPNTG
jgi:flavin reductase (DIM6/NTAB) family NADH-FMN oxidoreductase RutF